MRLPESWERARGTLAIAGVTALAWIGVVLAGREQWAAIWGGFISARALGAASGQALAPFWLTPLTATLLHGGLLHLGFNMMMLLFCGRAVEAIVGLRGLIVLYLVSAYVAAAATYAADPGAQTVMIGASGAISGVFGAYALLFSRNRVKVANPALARLLHVLWIGAAWVLLQLAFGFVASGMAQPIAIAAHIGGFFAGLALATPLLLWRYRGA